MMINLPKDVLFILETLKKNNAEGYVVGGAVRDSIMDREVHDWDIATSATPQQVIDMFQISEIDEIIPTGLQHGTVTIMISGIGYEVTTYRIDGDYGDSRHPDQVTFVSDIKKDLSRRDFTINAMAYNPWDGLVDPFFGIDDINDQVIRCIGVSWDRFEEDPLRILRALRFSAQFGFEIEESTKLSIFNLQSNLHKISAERIQSEFCKIIVSPGVDEVLKDFIDVIGQFIPEILPMIGFDQKNPWHIYDVFQHTVSALKSSHIYTTDPITRLAIFFHDIAKPKCFVLDGNGAGHFPKHPAVSAEMTDIIMRRLKFNNKTREAVVQLVKYHDVELHPTEKCVKKWLNRIGKEQLDKLLIVQMCDKMAQNFDYAKNFIVELHMIPRVVEKVLKENQCFKIKDLAVNGNDLIELGLPKGPAIGETLNMLLQAVIDGECKNNKDDLIQMIQKNNSKGEYYG